MADGVFFFLGLADLGVTERVFRRSRAAVIEGGVRLEGELVSEAAGVAGLGVVAPFPLFLGL